MYAAKRAGRNQYQLFDPEQDHHARQHQSLLSQLHQALAREELTLYYLPRVDLRRGVVLGAEALLRWRHPQRGFLSPAQFLAAAEDSDLVEPLGEYVLSRALGQLAAWRQAGLALDLSVNISTRHLLTPRFTEQLGQRLADHPELPAGSLELELREQAAQDGASQIGRIMAACRGLGVVTSLDDFGAGFASLTLFRRLPVDRIKIEQSLVRRMLLDEEDFAVVQGVIGLGQAFGRPLVAEGMESNRHGAVLLALGCDQAQGFGIAEPMPGAAVADWVRTFRPSPTWTASLNLSLPPQDLPLLLVEYHHAEWIDQVIGFASHPDAARAASPVLDPHHCHFGRWYDGAGVQRYGGLAEFRALGPVHDQVHTTALQLYQEVAAGRDTPREGLVEQLLELKEQLLTSLAELMLAVAEQRTQTQHWPPGIPLDRTMEATP
jgi:EAL domain-containing protein (putative c-di-GMP-specific phosphodiesterase class I)